MAAVLALLSAVVLAIGLREYFSMNFSVRSRASESGRWCIGDFIRYELGPSS